MNAKLKPQIQLKQMISNLKPRRRRLFRERDHSQNKSNIPTLKQADKIQLTLSSFHKRIKSKKKQQLNQIFAENISIFCRLNKQKSTYEQLFSKNKQNRQHFKRKLKRCTSAHVNRLKTFQFDLDHRQSYPLKKIRPFSSVSSKNHRKILTIQSQF